MLVAGCRSDEHAAVPDAIEASAQDAAGAPPPTPTDGPPDAVRARIEQQLQAIRDRPQCNRLTGCPPMTALMQDLPWSLGPVLSVLANAERADGYWIEMLIELVGQSGSLDAVRPLEALSRDRRWAVKIRAVLGLGRLAAFVSQNTRDLMAEAELMAAKSGDIAWLAAVLLTRSRIDPEGAKSHRGRLETLYPSERDQVFAISPPVLDWLVLIAMDARLTSAAPMLRVACLSENRFVSVNAMKAVGRFQDTGAVPWLLTRIEDRQPGVRRAALEALQDITGNRRAEQPAEWRAWAEKHGLATLPDGSVPVPQPSAQVPSGPEFTQPAPGAVPAPAPPAPQPSAPAAPQPPAPAAPPANP
jgi:hypothetical protein